MRLFVLSLILLLSAGAAQAQKDPARVATGKTIFLAPTAPAQLSASDQLALKTQQITLLAVQLQQCQTVAETTGKLLQAVLQQRSTALEDDILARAGAPKGTKIDVEKGVLVPPAPEPAPKPETP